MLVFLYFDSIHAIEEHDKIIDLTGGKHGIRDINLLKSALGHVRNDDYYPELVDKLTHLTFSIAKGHAFDDGNKRSAIVLGAYFLKINGYDRLIGKFIVEMENIVLWVADNIISKEFLAEIIRDIVEKGDITEENKLKILDVLDFKSYPSSVSGTSDILKKLVEKN
jgi:death-on-curing protein